MYCFNYICFKAEATPAKKRSTKGPCSWMRQTFVSRQLFPITNGRCPPGVCRSPGHESLMGDRTGH